MECPCCGGSMGEKNYEGVIIDECAGCGGTWLDESEISAIVSTKQETFSEEEQIAAIEAKGKDAGEGKRISCPRCSKPMAVFQYTVNSGVLLNRCPDGHGLWLDKGELEQVQIVMEEFDEQFGRLKPAKDLPQIGTKVCPRCKEPLREVIYETTSIDLCPKCKGAWCEGDELGKIVQSREIAFSDEDHKDIVPDESKAVTASESQQVASLPCVACGQTMRRSNYSYTSGIIIDGCRYGHGVWLDKDELERVQVFVERWETQKGRVGRQYAGALKKAKEETDKRYEEAIRSSNVSRFGFVNRFMQMLARKGFMD